MSCYHPITMYRRVGTKETTFKSKRILARNGSEKYRIEPGWEELQIPCGQCIGCRLTYSRQWAQRIQKESLSWEQNWFLTLTYDPMWVPRKEVLNKETGELITGMPLVPEHLTAFIKKLRRRWEYQHHHTGIRFYACGEYGEEHERPHYHICLMNFPIEPDSLELQFHNWLGDPIFKSKEIEKLWRYGITTIGALTWQSAAYVARYMVKKQKGPESDKYYESKGQIKEFVRMSLKPGIAREWYEQHKDEIYKTDEVFVPKRGGGTIRLKPALYFDRLYDATNPEEMKKIKLQRKEGGIKAQKLKLVKTSLTIEEVLKIAEEQHKERAQKLRRIMRNAG